MFQLLKFLSDKRLDQFSKLYNFIFKMLLASLVASLATLYII